MTPPLPAAFRNLAAGVVLAAFAWAHDASGNVTAQTEHCRGIGGGVDEPQGSPARSESRGGDGDQVWPGSPARAAGTRVTAMSYHDGGWLESESVTEPGQPAKLTVYVYDNAANRTAKTVSQNGVVQSNAAYTFNPANQLVAWTERNGAGATLRSAVVGFDSRGNRSGQTVTLPGGVQKTTSYTWDFQNRLVGVTDPEGGSHAYAYDYRTRRIARAEPGGATAVSWSGGLSLAEYSVSGLQSPIPDPQSAIVEYRRGPDMGGGIGGLLHSLRAGVPKYNLGNGRGDVVAQSDQSGALTWTASYEAFGTRPVETGTNADRQRANTKEEDPTGLLWEHFRYRDLETGVWLSRDPAGFVDGPNLYAYVNQNPWTHFDPEGLSAWSMAAKFALKGGDIGLTTAGLVSDFNSFKEARTFGEAAVPAFSMLSELLPVSGRDVKAGYDLAKKGLGLGKDAKSVDKVADVSTEGGMKLNAASKKTESGHVGSGNKPKKDNPYESAQDVSVDNNVTMRDPAELNLSHPVNISTPFVDQKEGTVGDLADRLRKGTAGDVPPIEVAKIKGTEYRQTTSACAHIKKQRLTFLLFPRARSRSERSNSGFKRGNKKRMIYDGNICQIIHEGLNEALFRDHPVWCECYLPSEIDFLENCGESRWFLEFHLIDRAKTFDANKTFYSWPLQKVDTHLERLPEFTHIGASFFILEERFSGFLWLVSGQLTGITVFYNGGESDFSLNDEMREENALEMENLFKEPAGGSIQIKISLSDNVSPLIDQPYARIPV